VEREIVRKGERGERRRREGRKRKFFSASLLLRLLAINFFDFWPSTSSTITFFDHHLLRPSPPSTFTSFDLHLFHPLLALA